MMTSIITSLCLRNGFYGGTQNVIKLLRQTKGCSAKQLLKMFLEKQWTLGGLNHLSTATSCLSKQF